MWSPGAARTRTATLWPDRRTGGSESARSSGAAQTLEFGGHLHVGATTAAVAPHGTRRSGRVSGTQSPARRLKDFTQHHRPLSLTMKVVDDGAESREFGADVVQPDSFAKGAAKSATQTAFVLLPRAPSRGHSAMFSCLRSPAVHVHRC